MRRFRHAYLDAVPGKSEARSEAYLNVRQARTVAHDAVMRQVRGEDS